MRTVARLYGLCMVLNLGGCAPAMFDLYEGPRLPDSEVALVRETFSYASLVSISKDGNSIWHRRLPQNIYPAYQYVRLRPGSYEVKHVNTCYTLGTGVGIDLTRLLPTTGDYPIANVMERSTTLDVEAGHTYSLRSDGCPRSAFKSLRGNSDSFFQDDTSLRIYR